MKVTREVTLKIHEYSLLLRKGRDQSHAPRRVDLSKRSRCVAALKQEAVDSKASFASLSFKQVSD